jgi:hypothetical protein
MPLDENLLIVFALAGKVLPGVARPPPRVDAHVPPPRRDSGSESDASEPGREFFTGVVARELARFPADELLSNQVRFVLRPLSRLRAHATAASYTLASIEWR